MQRDVQNRVGGDIPREQSVREQMPGFWGRIDDPLGIAWRIRNAAKRFSLQLGLRFAYGLINPPKYERPIFIIGAPRSGTTMLFLLLGASSQFVNLGGEGHDMWRRYHHPRWHGWRSDAVGKGQIGLGERRFINAYLYAHVGLGRFLEKTPCNSLRIPYLLELFPDAQFVVIKRNPCDVINSLINGWRDPKGRFRNYYVPKKLAIEGYDSSSCWCFTLIEGWRYLTTSTVPEIAFEQWRQFVEQLTAAKTLVPPGQWIEVWFEDILADPERASSALFDAIGVQDEPALSQRLRKLMDNPANALSAPEEEKWRKQNPQEIQALLPRIAALAQRAGYRVDAESGTCSPHRD